MVSMNERFLKPYNPAETEPRIYKRWEESGYFNPDSREYPPGTEHFSIVLPPPNVTGILHVGHAMMLAIEDTMVRYHRMRGHKTLWLPGTDSAAIATQSKVESEIYKKEKKTRNDLGREELLKRIDAFTKQSHDTITGQVRAMGSSVDWSREAYTLDQKRSYAVTTAFVRMYRDGLIYRGDRIVNWDPNMQTTVSDDEIEHVEETTPFYYLKYGPFIIGTARPETKFGDKYVVMHPDDARYAQYKHRDKINVEWINGAVTATIIKDTAIDMGFGTGVMTITPWHDLTDFEIAERHDLDKEQIIDDRGLLLPIAHEFSGQHIKKARTEIVEKLQQKGLIEKIDERYIHRIAINSRGGGVIEPQIKRQWFVDVDAEFTLKDSKLDGIPSGSKTSLKETMRHVVAGGQIKIMPDRYEKVYYHWIENLRDWCISRQIWYGHRIPVWYRDAEIHCDTQAPEGEGWEQDPDTLDTWFSSSLWTFSTLGWPNATADLALYHPTNIIETSYDIIFFWVARMILMSGYLLGDIPFATVYLHGLVRDSKGRKMSKSLGNIIDPLVYIEKYGADSLRMALVVGNPPGNDLSLGEDKLKAYKHFANKVWNATRFVCMSTEKFDPGTTSELTPKDEEYLRDFNVHIEDITKEMDEKHYYLAAEKLYHYFWHTFADVILEESKPILSGTDEKAAGSRMRTLHTMLFAQLRMLHPFMPFVTEEIWSLLGNSTLLMIERWPNGY
ncbi:MAG: valyl-tRNA synthetase [Parcubacteria group bacterium Greene1014_15]|nr:MAG: valyl-tRNA synthetase [Parcubacteria group bacterium Greene1014_15]